MSFAEKLTKNQSDTNAPTLVTNNELLASLCAQWRRHRRIALDTEFERSRTFFPRPALLQVCDGKSIWLLDPLEIDDFGPLGLLLADPGLVKVLHSASEDLELLFHLTDALPRPLFDTQIAAGLLGYGYSAGYQRLVKDICGIELSKLETRSNWLKRPLSHSQLDYAAHDVRHLPTIHKRLADELTARGRASWLEEESDALFERQRENRDYGRAYLRIGPAWKLEPRELGVLQALSVWREHEARRRDIPRAHLAKDEILIRLARAQPQQASELEKLVDGTPFARDVSTLHRIITAASALDTEQLAEPLEPPLDSKQFSVVLKALKKAVQDGAVRLQIAPELLGNRRSLERQVRHTLVKGLPGLIRFFNGWRKEVIGESLLNIMNLHK